MGNKKGGGLIPKFKELSMNRGQGEERGTELSKTKAL